jgi:hypothetical protein
MTCSAEDGSWLTEDTENRYLADNGYYELTFNRQVNAIYLFLFIYYELVLNAQENQESEIISILNEQCVRATIYQWPLTDRSPKTRQQMGL